MYVRLVLSETEKLISTRNLLTSGAAITYLPKDLISLYSYTTYSDFRYPIRGPDS